MPLTQQERACLTDSKMQTKQPFSCVLSFQLALHFVLVVPSLFKTGPADIFSLSLIPPNLPFGPGPPAVGSAFRETRAPSQRITKEASCNPPPSLSPTKTTNGRHGGEEGSAHVLAESRRCRQPSRPAARGAEEGPSGPWPNAWAKHMDRRPGMASEQKIWRTKVKAVPLCANQ